MSLQVFNVGDLVEYKDSHVHLRATITSIENRFSTLIELWGIWEDLINPQLSSNRIGYCWANENVTLIQPAMMPYDPNQQGDTDEDI